MSQNMRVLQYLKTHVGLTPLQALQKLGVYRLSGRIFDLRSMGYDIITLEKEVNNAHGGTSRVAEYRLVKESI